MKNEEVEVKKERKRKPSKSPPDAVKVKEEIAKIEKQTVTKKEIKELEAAVKKLQQESPESAVEPKGKRGRPRSKTPAAAASSSSAAAASAKVEETEIDSKTNKSHWDVKSKGYILRQLELRGFDNSAKWEAIKKLNKPSLLKMVLEMITNDNW